MTPNLLNFLSLPVTSPSETITSVSALPLVMPTLSIYPPLMKEIVFSAYDKSVRIPVAEPDNAPSPRKLPLNTKIDLLQHQAPYVVSLRKDREGYLSVPQFGHHFNRYGNMVYVFYTTDDELNVTGVYYGQTTEPFKRMSKYNTLFRDAQDRLQEGETGVRTLIETKKGVRSRKGTSNAECLRKVYQTIVGSKRSFWGVITLPSSEDSMNRHEAIQIKLAKQAEKIMQSGFIVLNMRGGRMCLGSIEIPSPMKPIVAPAQMDVIVRSCVKRKCNFDVEETETETADLKKMKLEEDSEVKVKLLAATPKRVKKPVVTKAAGGFVFHDYSPKQ